MGDARETDKAPDAFRTISEVAEDLDLPQHVLRFWETRFPQIKPVKRAGGRRFYRPEDVDLLRGIRQLLYSDGYTIKGVQKILKEQGIRHVQDLGVERDVAVMRSAAPPARPHRPGDEGITFGGLLGLLPRRRPKGRDEDVLDPLPDTAELPLPFPDPEADLDLARDDGEPLAPLPPRSPTRARRVEEPRFSSDDKAGRTRAARQPEPRVAPARGDAAPDEEDLDEEEAGRAEPYRDLGYEERSYQERRVDAHGYQERRFEERRFEAHREEDRHEAHPYEDHRYEDLRHEAPATQPPRRGEPRPAAERIDPTFAPERPDPVPQRRPTRGPAARVTTAMTDPEPPYEPEHPLLPIFDDEPPPAQRADPKLQRDDDIVHPGPPEEYIPPKLRRRPAEEQPAPVAYPGAAAPRAHGPAPMPRGDGSDVRSLYAPPPRAPSPAGYAGAEGEARRPVQPARAPVGRDPLVARPPEAARSDDRPPRTADQEPYGTAIPLPPDPEEEDDMFSPLPPAPVRRAVAPGADQHPPAAASRQPPVQRAAGWDPDPRSPVPPFRPAPPAGNDGFSPQPPRWLAQQPPAEHPQYPDHQHGPAPTGWPAPPPRPDEYPPAAPPAAVQGAYHWRAAGMPPGSQGHPTADLRVGPLIGPVEEVPAPAAPGGPQTGWYPQDRAPPGFFPAQAAPLPPAASPPPAQPLHPAQPWPAEEPAGEPAASAYGGRGPQEPLRPARPEQYLPPHLRSEPRVTGQAPAALPVLSRDDVHRLQAALYELGECRRLMDDALQEKDA